VKEVPQDDLQAAEENERGEEKSDDPDLEYTEKSKEPSEP
jgi:hypothetical protein